MTSIAVLEARRAYRLTLEAHFPKDAVPANGRARILSIGCGNAILAGVEKGFMGGSEFGEDSNDVEFYGVDNNVFFPQKVGVQYAEFVRHAKPHEHESSFTTYDLTPGLLFVVQGMDGRLVYKQKENYTFLRADAAHLDERLPGMFDAILMAHPGPDLENWTRIFSQASRKLKPSGVLFATTHFRNEARAVAAMLPGYRATVQENPHALHTYVPGVGPWTGYNFVVVGRKPEAYVEQIIKPKRVKDVLIRNS